MFMHTACFIPSIDMEILEMENEGDVEKAL